VGEVSQLQMGQSPDGRATNTQGDGLPLIGGAGDYEGGRVMASRYTTQATKICRDGDLIVSVRATIGKIAVADRAYCLGRGVAGIRPTTVNADFLRYFLYSQASAMEAAGTGTTFRQIDKKTLSSWPVPMPEPREQRSTVAKLDRLFSHSKGARDELDRIPRLVKRYREAILATAMQGDEQGMWSLVPLERLIAEGPTNGYSPRSGENPNGTLSLRLTATTRGVMDLSERGVKRLNEVINADSKFWLKPGDILFQRANSLEYVGTAAMYDGPVNTYIYPDLMIRIRVQSPFLARWVWRYSASKVARDYFMSHATGTAGNMPKINGTTIRQLLIPLPPTEDRLNRTLARLERSLAKVDAMLRESSRASAMLDRLEQATLGEAFRGESVPPQRTLETTIAISQ
jgi:type I restriction enzyme, S subunit